MKDRVHHSKDLTCHLESTGEPVENLSNGSGHQIKRLLEKWWSTVGQTVWNGGRAAIKEGEDLHLNMGFS